ncbi:MAG: CPBP family intramembrane metalloprotease [Actinomycetia bacterium]|nr:CPBP family intramembrane metalloprotease [Actinomycetes bacterium]
MGSHIPAHKEKYDNRADPNITWNTIDGIISVVFLAAVLTGVYFGSARIFIILSDRKLLNENISNISFIVLYGIQVLLMIGTVWFFALHRRKARLRDLGLKYYSIGKTLWYTLISMIAIFIISFLYVIIMSSVLGIEAPPSKIEILIMNRSVSNTVLLIVVSFIGPIIEEVFFRGFLYSAFKKNCGILPALFLSSILFSLVHLQVYSFIPLFIIGWILAYIFEKTKSLFPAIFLHAAYNLILILILLGQLEMINMY